MIFVKSERKTFLFFCQAQLKGLSVVQKINFLIKQLKKIPYKCILSFKIFTRKLNVHLKFVGGGVIYNYSKRLSCLLQTKISCSILEWIFISYYLETYKMTRLCFFEIFFEHHDIKSAFDLKFHNDRSVSRNQFYLF